MLLIGCIQGTLNSIHVGDAIKGQLPIELQQLLEHYAILFEVPIDLPPHRSHDHKIPFLDETKAVKIKHYKYPSIQKNELGKLVSEMLETGVIRDSTSVFASPVVMVKQKYGSWRLYVDYR